MRVVAIVPWILIASGLSSTWWGFSRFRGREIGRMSALLAILWGLLCVIAGIWLARSEIV